MRVTGVRDITERKRSEEGLRRQVAFDAVMTRMLSGFATCTAAELDRAVESGLGAFAGFLGADHAYVAVSALDMKTWSATHEWCAGSVDRIFENYQQLPFGVQPWSEAKILAGEVIRANTLADYPPEAEMDVRRIMKEGALSVLNVPIRGAAGRITGAVGLHSHARLVVWSDDDVARLKMVGDAIASLLERKPPEESFPEVSHRLHQAQDEEQRRIARELHDSTAQHLASATPTPGVLAASLSG